MQLVSYENFDGDYIDGFCKSGPHHSIHFSEKGGLGSGASFEQRDLCTSTFENIQEEIIEGHFVLFFIDIVVGGNPMVDTWLVH